MRSWNHRVGGSGTRWGCEETRLTPQEYHPCRSWGRLSSLRPFGLVGREQQRQTGRMPVLPTEDGDGKSSGAVHAYPA